MAKRSSERAFSFGPIRVRDAHYMHGGEATIHTPFVQLKKRSRNKAKGAPLPVEEHNSLKDAEQEGTAQLKPTAYAKGPPGAKSGHAWAPTMQVKEQDQRGLMQATSAPSKAELRPKTVTRCLVPQLSFFLQRPPTRDDVESVWFGQSREDVLEVIQYEYKEKGNRTQRRIKSWRRDPPGSVNVRYVALDGVDAKTGYYKYKYHSNAKIAFNSIGPEIQLREMSYNSNFSKHGLIERFEIDEDTLNDATSEINGVVVRRGEDRVDLGGEEFDEWVSSSADEDSDALDPTLAMSAVRKRARGNDRMDYNRLAGGRGKNKGKKQARPPAARARTHTSARTQHISTPQTETHRHTTRERHPLCGAVDCVHCYVH